MTGSLIVGSANLNDHSMFNDTEAALVTDDAELVRATRACGCGPSTWSATRRPSRGDPADVIDKQFRPRAEQQFELRRTGTADDAPADQARPRLAPVGPAARPAAGPAGGRVTSRGGGERRRAEGGSGAAGVGRRRRGDDPRSRDAAALRRCGDGGCRAAGGSAPADRGGAAAAAGGAGRMLLLARRRCARPGSPARPHRRGLDRCARRPEHSGVLAVGERVGDAVQDAARCRRRGGGGCGADRRPQPRPAGGAVHRPGAGAHAATRLRDDEHPRYRERARVGAHADAARPHRVRQHRWRVRRAVARELRRRRSRRTARSRRPSCTRSRSTPPSRSCGATASSSGSTCGASGSAACSARSNGERSAARIMSPVHTVLHAAVLGRPLRVTARTLVSVGDHISADGGGGRARRARAHAEPRAGRLQPRPRRADDLRRADRARRAGRRTGRPAGRRRSGGRPSSTSIPRTGAPAGTPTTSRAPGPISATRPARSSSSCGATSAGSARSSWPDRPSLRGPGDTHAVADDDGAAQHGQPHRARQRQALVRGVPEAVVQVGGVHDAPRARIPHHDVGVRADRRARPSAGRCRTPAPDRSRARRRASRSARHGAGPPTARAAAAARGRAGPSARRRRTSARGSPTGPACASGPTRPSRRCRRAIPAQSASTSAAARNGGPTMKRAASARS